MEGNYVLRTCYRCGAQQYLDPDDESCGVCGARIALINEEHDEHDERDAPPDEDDYATNFGMW